MSVRNLHNFRKIFLTGLSTLIILSGYTQPLRESFDEKYRSHYHFSPKNGWIGDPCGMVYYQGMYHLMWWGKAVTKDFTRYTEQSPKAMTDDDGSFAYYTGSLVIDKENTASFGPNSMIAVYTMNDRKTNIQSQGLSYSNDYVTFRYYEGNPVLNLNSKEFRDPTVFRHEESSQWIMIVNAPLERKIKFYGSQNLKEWNRLSDFGPCGAIQNIWECPDMYRLPVDENNNCKKWVLMTSVGPNRGQYFVGEFDGHTFTPDKQQSDYLLHGKGLEGKVFMDFEGNSYNDWIVEGNAFWEAPTANHLSGRLGKGMASSFGGTPANRGKLTSPDFIIETNAINFLIAGGDHPGKTCINLIINDTVIHSTPGDNSAYLKWRGWDVSNRKGQKARIEITDDYDAPDWGYINIDHILFSDVLNNTGLEHTVWVDYGTDFYAARAIVDYDGTLEHTAWLAWMNNWEYAREIPDSRRNGFWSIPRNITLKTVPEGIRMVQTPVASLKKLRGKRITYSSVLPKGVTAIHSLNPAKNVYEIDAVFTFPTSGKEEVGFNLCVGSGRKLEIRYNPITSSLCIDRTNCSFEPIKNFSKKTTVPVMADNGKLRLIIFSDKSSVEIFTEEGKKVMSLLTFADDTQTGVEVFSQNGNGSQVTLTAWPLKSVWKQ